MEYTLEEYIVVFIDILGATEKIIQDGDVALNIVHSAYNQTMEALKGLFSGTSAENLRPKVKMFSDNIAICFPAKANEEYKSFVAAALSSAFIQNQFLYNNYLLRGGIALGKCFIDETMIWGKALVDAYKVESSIAIYPRIVIHPDTVKRLNLGLDKRRQRWLSQDIDGLFFVDYMQERILRNRKLYAESLFKAYDDCDNLIAESSGNIKIMQKVNWHQAYLLEKLKDFGSGKLV